MGSHKRANRELLEVYSNPKQDRFQDLLEAICPDFLHTNLTKQNNYHCYSNIPQLLSAEVVLCTHKTTILCQFGLIICHQFTNSYLNQFSSIFGGNCIRGSSALLILLVSFLKIACLHVSFTAYENFYKLSKMHCLLVLTFHFPIFRMSECRNPTIKHIFTYTLTSPFISTYVTDLFLVIYFT